MTTTTSSTKQINRREFLYYLGGASLALTAVGVCGAVRLFTDTRQTLNFQALTYTLTLNQIPMLNQTPRRFHVGETGAQNSVWLSHVEGGFLALDARCPHEGALINWVEQNNRFECPYCGSKYRLNGAYIEGSALTGLAQYRVGAIKDSTAQYAEALQPISLENAEAALIDSTMLYEGAPRA